MINSLITETVLEGAQGVRMSLEGGETMKRKGRG